MPTYDLLNALPNEVSVNMFLKIFEKKCNEMLSQVNTIWSYQ